MLQRIHPGRYIAIQETLIVLTQGNQEISETTYTAGDLVDVPKNINGYKTCVFLNDATSFEELENPEKVSDYLKPETA